VSDAEASQEIWGVLGVLVKHHEVALGDEYHNAQRVVENRDIPGYLELAKRIADPLKYDQPALYWGNALVASFLKKFPFGKVAGLDPEAKARERSLSAELRCKIANKRIRYYSKRWYRLKNLRYAGSVFHSARLKIQRWLGPVNLDEVYDHARHGPGGALGCHRPFSTAYFKYSVEEGYTVSARCEPYAEAAILADPLWLRSLLNKQGVGPSFPIRDTGRPDVITLLSAKDARHYVRDQLKGANYNRVTYVPKTAQTHRAIAIEPLMNVYLQLGVGSVLKKRLAAAGCNLRSQERNQQMARLGSTDEVPDFLRPATVDLEMASDTLCIELVRELLPDDWFTLLSDLRSPYGLVDKDGRVCKWEKFSSMGNGFTFELESLIFYALVSSTVEHFNGDLEYVSVFGDDIVLPHYWYPMAREILQFAGFRTNDEKTFVAGPFRESCGEDYFEGTAVRPFCLKRRIKSRKDQLFLRNALTLFAQEYGDEAYSQAAHFVSGRLPGCILGNLLGPRTEDLEGHLHCDWDAAQRSQLVKWDRNINSWTYPTFRSLPRRWGGKPFDSFLYLQFMEGVVSMDRFEQVRQPLEVSKASVVLSGSDANLKRLASGVTYRWDVDEERPRFSTLQDYLLKSGEPAVDSLRSAILRSLGSLD